MLNNLTNFASIIRDRMVKKILAPTDLIALGRADANYDGGYRPIAVSVQDFKKNLGDQFNTTLFAFPFNYVVAPIMQETNNTLSGPSYFFGNTINNKSYVISGIISVQTNANFWYIGTISANEPLNGNLPWKVTGTVFAYDDSLPAGTWVQTGLCDGARFGDTNGGTVQADYCTIVEDYDSTPGSIDLYLAVNSSSAIGDIFGNVSFQYEFFVEDTFNLTFTNAI